MYMKLSTLIMSTDVISNTYYYHISQVIIWLCFVL